MMRRPTVPDHAVEDLAQMVRAAGADELADRLERSVDAGVALLALTIDQRAIILATLEDPPEGSPSFAAYCSANTNGEGGRDRVRQTTRVAVA